MIYAPDMSTVRRPRRLEMPTPTERRLAARVQFRFPNAIWKPLPSPDSANGHAAKHEGHDP